MKNAKGGVVLGAAAMVLIATGCSGSEPERIPDNWEHGNWSGPTGGLEWVVDDGQSYVSASPKELNERYQDTLLTGTEDERVTLVTAVAEETYGISSGGSETETIDLDVDGVAVRLLGERVLPGEEVVFLQLTGSTTVWLLSATPLQGEVDPYFLKHFVPEFDPASLPEPAEYDGDSLISFAE